MTSISSNSSDYGDYLNDCLSENELDPQIYQELLVGKQINQALQVQEEMIDTVNYAIDVFEGMA